MTEIKRIERGTFFVPPAAWPGGSGGLLRVGTLSPPGAANGTLIRSISFPSVRVAVGAPPFSVPPEQWWSQVTINWFMHAAPYDTGTVPSYGLDPSVVFLGRLEPTLVASPSEPAAYYVNYEGPRDGFQSHGQRRATGGDLIYLLTSMRWEDPLGGLDSSLYTGVSVSVRSTDVAVFGVVP